jgi:ketosteroid isomerase-like protein
MSRTPESRLQPPIQSAGDPEHAERVEQLLAANRRFYESFERLDVSMMDSVWAHNQVVSCMHSSPGWKLLRGWEEVRGSWAQIFSRLRLIRFVLSDLRVTIAGNIAWIVLTERLRAYDHESDEEIREATVATNVFERAGDLWRLLHHQATQLVELEGEAIDPRLNDLLDVPLPVDRHDTLRHQRHGRTGEREP